MNGKDRDHENSVIYLKDSGKHWKNDFFCDRIVLKLVYTQAVRGIYPIYFCAASGNEKGKR